jgi:guanylate kinase
MDRTKAPAAPAAAEAEMTPSRPILFNLSGPYAVGKDTLIDAILAAYPGRVHRVSTITTRPASANADPSYESVSAEEFARRTAAGRWIVNHQLGGAVAYGTSIDEIERVASQGRICVHSIYAGPEGAGKLREVFGRRVFSLGLLAAHGSVETQLEVLRRRLLDRGRDDPATIEARLKHQIEALRYVQENPVVPTGDGPLRVFDQVTVNAVLERAVECVLTLFAHTFALSG